MQGNLQAVRAPSRSSLGGRLIALHQIPYLVNRRLLSRLLPKKSVSVLSYFRITVPLGAFEYVCVYCANADCC